MNVALFASAFHPHVGGVEELCRQLSLEYLRRGMGVAVFTNRWPRSLPEYEVVEGIVVHRLAFRVPADGLKAKVSFALTNSLVRRRMMARLREFRPDVLHVQCVSCNATYALEARKALEIPLVITLQGELTMDATQLFQRAAWAKRVLRQSLEYADAITACSSHTLEEAEAWFGKPFGERGGVIHNGMSLEDALAAKPYTHSRPYLLAMGRHVREKGFDLLLRAMAGMRESSTSHDLILAGDGPEHQNLKALARELGLERRVKFAGRIHHREAVSLFAGCSFFVLPSRHEPFGIVNLEAMAAGKAVIATRVGGVPEVVFDRETGFLVDPHPDKLAAVIGQLSEDEPLRARFGEAGRKRAQQFSWPAIADEYLALYDRVCGVSAQTDPNPKTYSFTSNI